MALSKQQIFVGLIAIQMVVIFFLIYKAISLRNENISARTVADYYQKAYEEIAEKGDPVIRSNPVKQPGMKEHLNSNV